MTWTERNKNCPSDNGVESSKCLDASNARTASNFNLMPGYDIPTLTVLIMMPMSNPGPSKCPSDITLNDHHDIFINKALP